MFFRQIFVLLVSIFFLSCSSYRIIKLETVLIGQESSQKKVHTYAATKNNVIIPELSIDRRGFYPQDYHVAKERLKVRKKELRELIAEKYDLPNTFLYQLKFSSLWIGFVVMSPILLPLLYINEQKEGFEYDENIFIRYFRDIALEPIPQKPKLQDELYVTNES